MKKSHCSFTLIELLIVVAIIGILASTIIISLTGAMARARDVRKKADLAAIYKAIISYESDHIVLLRILIQIRVEQVVEVVRQMYLASML